MLNDIKAYKSDNLLQEVKKDHCGSGLLLERDGHIYDGKDTIKQINEDIKNNHEFICPDHFVVSAVFQKYGIKNANGRIYPENILRREVEKYIRERVNTRCAFGALDHPSCQLADTKILTEKGWKDIQDVQEGENVLTITPEGVIEIHPVLRKIDEEYEGDMIHFKNNVLDYTVTPSHKLPLLDSNKEYKGLYSAQEIYEQLVDEQDYCSLSRVGKWHNNSNEYFIIPKLSDEELVLIDDISLREVYEQDLVIPMDVWMKFIGIYITKGYCSYTKKEKRNDCITIFNKKTEVIEAIKDMLEDFPLSYTYFFNKRKHLYTFKLYDLRLSKYLSHIHKFIPFDIKKQGVDMLNIFYDWFVLGNTRYYSNDISLPKQLALDINEIQMKIGHTGHFYKDEKNKYYQDNYFSTRGVSHTISLSENRTKIFKEYYQGRVYCIEVQNHTFYTMDRSGYCLWTGNSTTLSGHDVTHNILNLEWQGHTLIGEMELHLSPGYKKYGICSTSGDLVANMLLSNYLVGVSSRGVGSVVKKPGDHLLFDHDFDLIGWDVVLEPSTPNANIGLSREDLKPFIENKKYDKNLLDEQIISNCLQILS